MKRAAIFYLYQVTFKKDLFRAKAQRRKEEGREEEGREEERCWRFYLRSQFDIDCKLLGE